MVRNKAMILKQLKIGFCQCGQKYKSVILPQKFTTVMRRAFTFMLYQRKLCALKMKNSLVARNQKSNLPSYLLPTWIFQTSYFRQALLYCQHGYCRPFSSENLLICAALRPVSTTSVEKSILCLFY